MNESDNLTPSRPRSMTQPPLAFSLLPPLNPSSSSSRCNSLPLMNLSPSAPVESRDSSIKSIQRHFTLRRHYMSVSFDSCLYYLPKLPPSQGNVSSSSSIDGDENASGLEFGSGDYTDDELNKIAKSTKLQEIASDPKKVRSSSATCSKQRKLQYMIDLEHRINFLENENASIFEKIKLLEVKRITLMQNDKTMMMNEKKKIMIRIESLEQLAQLRDVTLS
ncbi:putative transcription factor bZIP family [Arabidopsis thaliana]